MVQCRGGSLMGTSTSSQGPGSGSPLVPPWADTDGQGPGPVPEPQRFRGFRTNLGKFVSGGDQADLLAALRGYAGSATGGSAVGPRRFGSMARAGGALFDALSALRDGREVAGIDLGSLIGRDTGTAIDAIVRALVPADGDADRVWVAMNEALSECLEGLDEFDFAHITDEMIINTMLTYVAHCVFEQIVLDSRDAFAKARVPDRLEQAERALQAVVRAATDMHLAPLLSQNVPTLNGAQVEAAQLRAIQEVWAAWEGYEP
jgi:hypothetical protein